MKDKGILLLHYEDKHRKLNYVIRDGRICVITSKSSNKINYIQRHQTVVIEFEDGNMHTVNPEIIENEHEVIDLFNYMTDLDNNHFTKYLDMFIGVAFNL